MLNRESPLPLPVARAAYRLGLDLSRAQRRRPISQASLAERRGVPVCVLQPASKFSLYPYCSTSKDMSNRFRVDIDRIV